MSKVQLKDNKGENIFPITISDAITFSDGETLEQKLDFINPEVDWDDIKNKPQIVSINDSSTSTANTWSSDKVNKELTTVKNQLNSKAEIMDGNTSNQFTWSGEHITEYISSELENVPTINDNTITSRTQTWSACKIDDELRLKSDSSHSHSLSSLTGTMPVSKLSGTISRDNLPVAFGDVKTLGICYLDANPNNTWHSGEAIGAHANAVKQVYDRVVTAQSRADAAYNLANHSHPYASSSHTHSNYASSSHTHSNYLSSSNLTILSTSVYPSSSYAGSVHCGKYGNYWNYVVANHVCWNNSGGYAFFDADNADSGKTAYDFLKQYKSTKSIKYNVANLLNDLEKRRDISEEEQDEINVLKKIDDVFDIYENEDEGNTELYTNGTKLTETIAEGIEYLIGKLEEYAARTNELENEIKELKKQK